MSSFCVGIHRMWLQRRNIVLVAVIIVTLALSLLAFATWFIWRRRQQTVNAYKPVGAVVPEQELQPL